MRIFLLLLLANVSFLAKANTVLNEEQKFQSLTSISDLAIEFAKTQIPEQFNLVSISSGYIDSRMKLAQCTQDLEAFLPNGFRVNTQFTVGVKCGAPFWKLYVIIKADIQVDVVVSTKMILKGESLSKENVTIKAKSLSSYHRQHFSNEKDVVGKLAKHTIRPNSAIRPNQLETDFWVRRKQEVIIMAKNKSFQVQMKGVALKNGSVNEQIKVRNSSSNKIVEAIVVKRGVVRVNF